MTTSCCVQATGVVCGRPGLFFKPFRIAPVLPIRRSRPCFRRSWPFSRLPPPGRIIGIRRWRDNIDKSLVCQRFDVAGHPRQGKSPTAQPHRLSRTAIAGSAAGELSQGIQRQYFDAECEKSIGSVAGSHKARVRIAAGRRMMVLNVRRDLKGEALRHKTRGNCDGNTLAGEPRTVWVCQS